MEEEYGLDEDEKRKCKCWSIINDLNTEVFKPLVFPEVDVEDLVHPYCITIIKEQFLNTNNNEFKLIK